MAKSDFAPQVRSPGQPVRNDLISKVGAKLWLRKLKQVISQGGQQLQVISQGGKVGPVLTGKILAKKTQTRIRTTDLRRNETQWLNLFFFELEHTAKFPFFAP